MAAQLSPNEEAQLLQTIEMFEVIAQTQPTDCQLFDILKEAYFKLGRQQDVVNTSKRIAQAYVQMGQLSSAILEYESVLQLFPDDPDVLKALAEIENRATCLTAAPPPGEPEVLERPKPGLSKLTDLPSRMERPQLDDGRSSMQKLFVEGKHLSESEFSKYWMIPPLDQETPHPLEPFILLIADKGLVVLETSLKLISDKARLGYLPLEKYDIDIEVARSFPRDVCRRWCVLPFDRMSKSILVATANPFNKQAARELESATQSRLLWYLASPSEIVKSLKKIFR
jgi:tetratricopeptide (TPR) repeat protein